MHSRGLLHRHAIHAIHASKAVRHPPPHAHAHKHAYMCTHTLTRSHAHTCGCCRHWQDAAGALLARGGYVACSGPHHGGVEKSNRAQGQLPNG